MGSIAEMIKNHPRIKRLILWLMIPNNQAKPRAWVSFLINPFFHIRKRGSIIRHRTRMDVIPFNNFELGTNSLIEDFATINNGVGAVLIGDDTLVGIGNVIIGPVTIGNHVILAQNVVVSGLNHQYTDTTKPIKSQPVQTKLIVIHDECWIGANSVITAGITIGKHAVIAAGSVVTKDIPAYAVAAGSPARVIKLYNHESGEWEKV
jgi:acetyltransferase-like isoleucine patch superfamily enzyme